MSSTPIVVMAIMLIVLVSGALAAWSVSRRRSRPSGSEYDRVVAQSESRLAGERELRNRQGRRALVEFMQLPPQSRDAYVARWQKMQVQFERAPRDAVNEADDLATGLIGELGYPTGEHNEQLSHLSAGHARIRAAYREAHQVSLSNRRGEATTEQLRLALHQFRAIIAELIGEQPNRPMPYKAGPTVELHHP